MGLQGKSQGGSQLSLVGEKPKVRPNQKEVEYILNVFKNEHNNTIKNVSSITGFSMNCVSRIIEKEFDYKKGHTKLFQDSKWCNKEAFKKYIYSEEDTKKRYRNADFAYYVEAVLLFSTKNPRKKRTDDGWRATLRQFMNSDIKNGGLAIRNKTTTKRNQHHNF